MNVFIQAKATARYWQAPGRWTAAREQAYVFPDVLHAFDCCVRHQLPPVNLVIGLADPALDICLDSFQATAGQPTPEPSGQRGA